MSDLIIKPSGTNANFKVQNPSGTDKIVMNSSGTITTGTLGSGVTFPAGSMTFIKNVTFSGVGSIGDQQNWYPTDMSSDSAKTLYGNLSATEHASYSKIKIEFSFDMRVNKATHAFIDIRLVRWQGSTTAPSTSDGGETNLYWAQTGVVTGIDETYNPVASSVIDDISSLTGTIYYAIQYRNAGGNNTYAGTMYAGFSTSSRHQMIFTGIV